MSNSALKADGIIDEHYAPPQAPPPTPQQQQQAQQQQQQPQYPIQIQNATETVIMEVMPGMQITLPTPDGQNQTVHGPYQIKMQLAHNAPPPIQGNSVLMIFVDQKCQFFKPNLESL